MKRPKGHFIQPASHFVWKCYRVIKILKISQDIVIARRVTNEEQHCSLHLPFIPYFNPCGKREMFQQRNTYLCSWILFWTQWLHSDDTMANQIHEWNQINNMFSIEWRRSSRTINHELYLGRALSQNVSSLKTLPVFSVGCLFLAQKEKKRERWKSTKHRYSFSKKKKKKHESKQELYH